MRGTLPLTLFVVVVPALSHADDGGGAPLACIGTDTFLPLGHRWCLPQTGANADITVLFNSGGPVQEPNATPAAANAAAFSAFGIWASSACTSPQGMPNIRFVRGPDYANRDNGDNPSAGTYNNVVWWVIDSSTWPADSQTVAYTTVGSTGVGFIVNGDMQFNNFNFAWRINGNPSIGCNAANANCYDIESVALHEVGHFIGLGHVSCSDALMFPSESNSFEATGLSHHEVAAVCDLYAPRPNTNAGSVMGEQCTSSANCQADLVCLKATDTGAAAPEGFCGEVCSATSDCPLGWVCSAFADGSDYCFPGVHLAGVPPETISAVSDLCAACSDGDQCDSSICAIFEQDGFCTQQCSAPSYSCPAGFNCVATASNLTVCSPPQTDDCSAYFTGTVLNDVCLANGTASDPNLVLNRPCQTGLYCFAFNGGLSACVQQCASTDPTAICAQGYQCCYGVDSSSHCLGSSPTAPAGGCFQIGHVGDACVAANQSICDSNTLCFTTGDPTLAQCYDVCGNTPCGVDETCVNDGTFTDSSGNTLALCCDTVSYVSGSPTTCVPHGGPCLREVGVQCSQNADCASSLCLKYNNTAACSAPCSSNADCPSASADVNGDGQPDGGSQCLPIGAQLLCWPNEGPISLPACAKTATATNSGGCGCVATGRDSFLYGGLLTGAWLWRRRRCAPAARTP